VAVVEFGRRERHAALARAPGGRRSNTPPYLSQIGNPLARSGDSPPLMLLPTLRVSCGNGSLLWESVPHEEPST